LAARKAPSTPSKKPRKPASRKRRTTSAPQKLAANVNTAKGSSIGRVDDQMLEVYRHPLRMRMLVVMNELGECAPSELADRLGVSVQHVSYHMKVLLKHDYAEFLRVEPVGSTVKHIYRALRNIYFPMEEWERLHPFMQNQVLSCLFMAGFADAQIALLCGAYEKRPESHASWTNIELDEKSWQQIIRWIDQLQAKVMKLAEAVEKRKEAGGLGDEDLLPISVTLAAFVLPSAEERAGHIKG
jgi:DNA-binding transcriptional ArsR family regulator